ncbi:MAG: hypothetical protein WD042_03060 [Phycisphaeraceae bacterium]
MTTPIIRAAGTTDLLHLQASATIEAAAGKTPRVEISAYDGGVMVVAGFGPVAVDLAGMELPPRLNLLADHESVIGSIVGTATPAVAGGRTLTASGTLSSATPAGQTIIALHRDGVTFEASIGAEPVERRFVREKENIVVNGRSITAEVGGFLLVTKSRLKEISVVPVGASANTAVSIAARGITMKFSEWLKAKGFDEATITDTQRASLQAAYTAEQTGGTATATADPRQVELQRQADITRIAHAFPHVQQEAITAGWDATRTELEVIRASRPSASFAGGGNGRIGTGDKLVAEAALLMVCGYESAAAKLGHDGQAIEAARSLGLNNLRAWDAFNNRMHTDGAPSLRAGFSTASLAVLMSSIPKMLLQEFEQAPASCDSLASWQSLPDFKQQSLYRLLALGGGLEEVGQDGELHHGNLSESDTRITLGTYGKMFTITRKALANDDVQAIASIPRIIVMEASRLRGEKFTALLAANLGNFFHGNNSNIIDDVLAFAGLNAALVKLRSQVDADNRALGLQPFALLCGPALEATARQLVSNMALTRDQSADLQSTANPFGAMNLRVEVEPRLGTAVEWYLTSRPADGAIIIGTLNGAKVPVVETPDAAPNVLGEVIRGFYDFAIALCEPRAIVKSSGDAGA